MNYRDEQEIDLIDLCKQVLKKWRVVVIFMLVGLVAGGVVGYVRSAHIVNSETLGPITDEETVKNNLEALKSSLSEREIIETEQTVDSYLAYNKVYSEKVKYGDNSIRMKLNAESVPTLTASYVIGDYYEVTYPTIDEVNYINDIVSVYSKELYDEPVINEIAAVLGGNIAETYVRELYSVYSEGNSILSITVTARSKEECQSVMDILTKYLELMIPTVKNLYTHSLTYLNTYYSKNMNSTILSEQQAQADALLALERTMLTVSSSLTANQRLYFTALVDDAVKNKEVQTTVIRSFSTKHAALGLIAGAFLVIIVICLKYIMSPTIKTKDEMATLFGVNLLGTLNDKTEGDLGMIVAGVGLGARKAEVNKVHITSALSNETVDEVSVKVVDAINKNYGALTVASGKSILTDPSSLASLAESEAVIFVEKLKASKYDDIAKEIEIAKNYGVKILGAVIME